MKNTTEPIHYVYYLICPISNEVKYIGVSMNPEVRFKAHLTDRGSNKAKVEWIQNLKENGLLPILEVVEKIESRSIVFEIETNHIKEHYKSILNVKRKNNFCTEYPSNALYLRLTH